MSAPVDYYREAKTAIELERVRDFVERHASDPTFWEWVNSTRVEMPLFFSVAKQFDQAEASHLSAQRQRLLWQYQVALTYEKEEPRSPVLTKMAEIGLQTAYQSPPRELMEETARDMLENSKLMDFIFESQQAVYLYNFLLAAEFPSLWNTIINNLSTDAQLFRDQAILSMAVRAFGPPIVELLAKACLESSTQGEEIARVLERVTGQPRAAGAARDYAIHILNWYAQVHEKLRVDESATYPAPPFKPLLIVLPECPQCGNLNEFGRRTCIKCRAILEDSTPTPDTQPTSIRQILSEPTS